MKRIKEKPKMGKPKEKPKSAGMPKQVAPYDEREAYPGVGAPPQRNRG